jgi:ribosomal protein S17
VVVKPQKTIVVTFKRVINIRNIKTLVKQNVYMAHDELKCRQSWRLVLLEESSPFSRNKKMDTKRNFKIYEK